MKKIAMFLSVLVLFGGAGFVFAHEGHDEGAAGEKAELHTIKGEVVDLMCYIDHGAVGEKHAKCAQTCIESGGPVGLLTPGGEVYLVIGQHEPINKQLAPLAAKTISVKGKVVERSGMKMIENAEIVK